MHGVILPTYPLSPTRRVTTAYVMVSLLRTRCVSLLPLRCSMTSRQKQRWHVGNFCQRVTSLLPTRRVMGSRQKQLRRVDKSVGLVRCGGTTTHVRSTEDPFEQVTYPIARVDGFQRVLTQAVAQTKWDDAVDILRGHRISPFEGGQRGGGTVGDDITT